METLVDSSHMQGKICLVTGASSGIGKAAAMGLATMGAEVILVGRNEQRTSQAAAEITAKTGNQSVHYLLADFSDLQQVRDLATKVKDRFTRLDVLVNNAGAYFLNPIITPYGVEMMLLVNHIAPFLLTNRLLGMLQQSAPARIVNVASDAHHYGRANFDELGYKGGSFGMDGYGRSKLANVLFTYELARRLDDTGVTVTAVHPGFVTTDLWRINFPLIGSVLKSIVGLFALTPEEGADTLIYLATSPEVAGITGKYFVKRKETPTSKLSYDEDAARNLWEFSERITSL